MVYWHIQQELVKKQDIKYQSFMLKSIPNENHLIGVQMNILKKMANLLIQKERWQEYISCVPFYHEEKMIQALIIAKQVKSFDDVILIKNFIPHITNWAVCDCFCTYLKAVQVNLPLFFDFIQPYLKSDNEFDVRFSLVLLLTYYVNKEYLKRIFKILDDFSHKSYYAYMGAAWLLSVCYSKYPEQTLVYLSKSKLDNITYNKAIQKITELSFVSDKECEMLKKLKHSF